MFGGRYQCPGARSFWAKALGPPSSAEFGPSSGLEQRTALRSPVKLWSLEPPAGKVLLGSGFPNIPYAYAEQIAGLVRLDLGQPWLRAICWDNAARLFGLTGGGS